MTTTTAVTTGERKEDRSMPESTENSVAPVSTLNTSGNLSRTAQSHRIWDAVLASAQVRGFFGAVSLEVIVQDGTIQTIRRRVEQIDK